MKYLCKIWTTKTITKFDTKLGYILTSSFILFLSSCLPVMNVNLKKQKEYPPLEQNAHVVIYKNPQQIPSEYEKIGKMEIVCSYDFAKKEDTTKCDSISVYQTAISKARETGGNALLIKKYKKPTLLNDYYLLDADVIKVFDFSSPLSSLYTRNGRGTWDLRLSMPYINHFILKPNGEKEVSSTGFLGVASGFDYYHKNNQYISVLAGGVMDHVIPVPMGVDYVYGEDIVENESCKSMFIGLTNNHRFRFFSFGYGLSYSHNSWRHTYNGGYNSDGSRNTIPPDRKYNDNALGLMFTGYWLSKGSFGLGVVYRPSFIRLNIAPAFKYEHLVSIDLAWRIRLKTVIEKK